MTRSSSHRPCDRSVLFVVFNRLDTTTRVFERIRAAAPPRLYVASDGPRTSRTGESEIVAAVREYVTKNVDWPCSLKTRFLGQNMGCRDAVSGAVAWFFENETEGIVLEDDCLPDPTFFNYCSELLGRYREDSRISVISGSNFQNGRRRSSDSYYFSRYCHIWGWASWRRVWMDYDKKMLLWPEVRKNGGLESILRDKADVKFWTRIFDMVYAGRIQTWAHQLTFSSWVNSRLSIIPNVNLVSNIGFNRPDATNTIKAVPYAGLSLSKMVFPLRHPKEMIPDLEADRYTARQQFSLRPFPVRVFNKLWAILVSMRALFRLHVQLKGERSFVMHFLKVFRRTVCEIAYFFSQFHAPKSLGRKVLLLRLDHLGDFLIFSAVIKEYRKLFSDYKFFLILDEHLMSLAKKLNGIDEVIPFAGRRFGQNLIYRIRLLNRIRAESFEVVVDPHCSRSEASALVTRFSNAKERIGFATDTVNISADEKRRTDSFYTRLVSVPQNLPELQKHQRLLSLLGVPTNNLIPQLNLSEAELHRAEVLLERNGIKHKTPHFVIAPGASVEYRCWPGLKYSEFITRLSKAGGRVVLVGSPGERSLCADIIAKSSVPALNLAGQTDLISAAGVLKLSRGVLSNESGPVHLAAAVRVPVVCVMGGGYPGRFFPYGDLSRNVVVQRRMECFGCGWHCKYWSRGRKNSVPCIADIEVADVFNAFSEFL